MELKIGQRWRTRGGSPARVEAVNDGRDHNADRYPWLVRVHANGTDMPGHTVCVTAQGAVYLTEAMLAHSDDLVELVEDVIEAPGPGAVGATPPAGNIGDVNSTERGSGARYNAGKAPFELIPVSIIAEAHRLGARERGEEFLKVVDAMASLGLWQERQGDNPREHLIDALNILGLDGFYECARVFDYGRRKYAEWNWAKGMKWSAVLGCAVRHALKMLEGEPDDAESGLPHRGHFFCNVVMLLTYEYTFDEGDDRPAEGMLFVEPKVDLGSIDFERKRADDTEGGAA